MTVEELIQVLATFPPHATVILNMDKNELANGRECGCLELVKAARYAGDEVWRADFDGRIQSLSLGEVDDEIRTVVNLTPQPVFQQVSKGNKR